MTENELDSIYKLTERELTRNMDSGGVLEQNADAEKAEEKEELSNV